MAKTTKASIIAEFQVVIDEHKKYTDILFTLVDDGKVNTGCLITRPYFSALPYKWLYGQGKKGWPCRLYGYGLQGTKMALFSMYLSEMKQELEKIKDFVDRPQHGWVGYANVD